MKKKIMKKNAFTMLELVFVIVVLGIIASLAIPRFDRDLRQGAKDNLLSAIRHTQALALVDNKTNPTEPNWQRALWQIQFSNDDTEWVYSIGSNMNYNDSLEKNESAIDPVNGKYMFSDHDSPANSDESPNIFLTKKYGINNVTFNGCQGTQNATDTHIAFDNLGRPHRGVTEYSDNDYRTLVTTEDCIITFDFTTEGISDLNITIAQQTGYVSGN